MIIVGISGKAEHGKSEVCKYLKQKYNNYKINIIPLASFLKDYARKIGWDGSKDEKGRSLLQQLGPVLKNYYGGDCFARWSYESALNNNLDILLIDDMRLLDEVAYFTQLHNQNKIKLLIYRVVRPGHQNKLTHEQRSDISETALDDYSFNRYLYNYNLENLKQQIDRVIRLEEML